MDNIQSCEYLNNYLEDNYIKIDQKHINTELILQLIKDENINKIKYTFDEYYNFYIPSVKKIEINKIKNDIIKYIINNSKIEKPETEIFKYLFAKKILNKIINNTSIKPNYNKNRAPEPRSYSLNNFK